MTTARLDEVTVLVAAPTVYDSSIVRFQNTTSNIDTMSGRVTAYFSILTAIQCDANGLRIYDAILYMHIINVKYEKPQFE